MRDFRVIINERILPAREALFVASTVITAAAIRVTGHVVVVVVVARDTIAASYTVASRGATGVVIAAVSVSAIDGKPGEIAAVVVASGVAAIGSAVALVLAVSVITIVVAHCRFSFSIFV